MPSTAASAEADTAKDSPKAKAPKTPRISKLSEAMKARFDRFWAVYPRKVGKGKAEESFAKYRPDDELTDRTFEYRQSIGIRRVTDKTNRFDVTRDSEEKVDVWLRAHGIPLTFAAIRDQETR